MANFEIGAIYRRREIHDRFGGQPQGGISTPTSHPVIFLFTGGTGKMHGYNDEWQPDGSLWYYGEGQRGDMEFVRGNAAIVNHSKNGKSLHLFEAAGGGHVRYRGEFHCESHHEREAPDSCGNIRKAIVFELRQV